VIAGPNPHNEVALPLPRSAGGACSHAMRARCRSEGPPRPAGGGVSTGTEQQPAEFRGSSLQPTARRPKGGPCDRTEADARDQEIVAVVSQPSWSCLSSASAGAIYLSRWTANKIYWRPSTGACNLLSSHVTLRGARHDHGVIVWPQV
jgi:hypothetical protein